jgi:hypothetical protein
MASQGHPGSFTKARGQGDGMMPMVGTALEGLIKGWAIEHLLKANNVYPHAVQLLADPL